MPSPKIPDDLRKVVFDRAQFCCEYCLTPAASERTPYQVDHVIARKHGGVTQLDNLALACFDCNNNKGSDVATFDPADGRLTHLFDPRRQAWRDHFELQNAGMIVGKSPAARATISLLQINAPLAILLRAQLLKEGRMR